MNPQRIQRQRTKGWKMPENTVYVGRPSIWGNPFDTAEEFRRWLLECRPGSGKLERDLILERIEELRGKNLACWCPIGVQCHADVLLELANR